MRRIDHALVADTPGTTHRLTSLHYGPAGSRKACIQASLHADEVPGMLVAHHLRQQLAALESAGRLLGEVVLVPAANPVGLSQWLLRGHVGRFDQTSGENFNRGYSGLVEAVLPRLAGQLGPDARANVACVRAALREAVAALPAGCTLASLRRTLYGLAIDADIVLDLHCDGEALLHFYTTPACWPGLQPLAQAMGAPLVLLAEASGGEPFDEACSLPWQQLAARPELAGLPLPQACLATTIELRGEADVRHDLAAQDAAGILRYLQHAGLVADDPAAPAPPLAPLECQATPLAGSIPLLAPHGGAVVFLRQPGARVRAGEPLAELLDPLEGTLSVVAAPVDGLFFARENRRFAVAGMAIGKVAGHEARRSGALLSP